jgi:predicted permease
VTGRDADIDEEMRHHIALLTEANVAAGMGPTQARRAALVRFGSPDALLESARDQRAFMWLKDAARDLSYGARMLRRSPSFTAAAALTLALGIGASTAVFSVVSCVLLRPLSYPESDRLVVLHETNPPRFPELIVLPEHFARWPRETATLEPLAAVRTRFYNLTGTGDPARISGARVTASTFSTLRVRPFMGRDFVEDEDGRGKGSVVIVSHRFWQSRLGGRPSVLGETLRLDGRPFSVIGVMPEDFVLEAPIDIFTPAAYTGDDPENRLSLGGHSILVFGRLRPGATLAQARNEMSVMADRLARQFPETGKGWGVKVAFMLDARVGDTRPVLFSLLGAVGFLLLIACANVANLLLARASGRHPEMALRAALGASRWRIVRQLLAEGALLAAGGGLLGVLGAWWACRALVALAPDGVPRVAEIVLDARALGFAIALVLITGVGSGLAPARVASRPGSTDPRRIRKWMWMWMWMCKGMSRKSRNHGRAAGPNGGGQRLRGALVVAEVAIAVVLLAGAGLLIRSFAHLQAAPRGFTPRGALTFDVSLPRRRYPSDAELAAFAVRAEDRLGALPGVSAAGASQALPFTVDLNIVFFAVAGRPAVRDNPITYAFEVTPGYLSAMGIPLLRGRGFEARDRAGAPPVAIINQTIARRYFPDEDPIGQRIGRPGSPVGEWGQIVGVVGDVKDGVVAPLDGDGGVPQIYVPFAQNPYDALTFVVRGAGSVSQLAASVRAALHEVDPEQPMATVRPLVELVGESIARQRFAMLLLSIFSSAALLLAAVGIYGVTAYAVAQRTAEIGIRMALGARRAQVLDLVLRQGMVLATIGIGLGLVGAAAATRFLQGMLFGITPLDPTTFGATAALFGLVAAVATYVPARRATRVDPIVALRVP